jgi:ketosteroid isomerase-like protein
MHLQGTKQEKVRMDNAGFEAEKLTARSPEEICRLFQKYMAKGDIDLILSLYDKDVVFLNQSSEPKRGKEALRKELAPFASAKASFDFNIKQLIQAGDIALTHTEWNVSSPHQMSLYAIEVARRQSDGSWRWLIGDPFTVGRNFRQ